MKNRKLKNGDFYSEDGVSGVYSNGGIYANLSEDESDLTSDNEWTNLSLRNSLAVSSVVLIREIKPSTYFNKEKINLLKFYIENNKVDSFFINTILSNTQKRNLSK